MPSAGLRAPGCSQTQLFSVGELNQMKSRGRGGGIGNSIIVRSHIGDLWTEYDSVARDRRSYRSCGEGAITMAVEANRDGRL